MSVYSFFQYYIDQRALHSFPTRRSSDLGKSKNIYRRVKSYFTAAETRKRINEMVHIATEVTPIPCATDLEAEVRELRLITELRSEERRVGKECMCGSMVASYMRKETGRR